MKRDTAVWLACMILASIGLVLALGVVPYVPMQDGPQHLLAAHIEDHYRDAGSVYPETYRLLPQFAGKGFALLYRPLESVLPWRTALHVALAVVALAFAWGFALVLLALDAARGKPDEALRHRPFTLLGFVIALPWTLYMGFFPFVVGTTLGLYTLAFVLRRAPSTPRARAVLAALLLAQAVAHAFTVMLTGVIVAALLVAAAPRAERLRELARTALTGLPAMVLVGLTVVFRDLHASTQQEIEAGSFTERLGELSRWFAPGPEWRAWLVVALLVAGVAGTLVRARRGKATRVEQTMAWLGVAFFVLTLVAPLHVPGWQFVAPRFALLAAALGLALVRLPERTPPAAARALLPVLGALCLLSELASASLHRRLASGCSDVLAGLDAPLHLEGPQLPIILDSFCGLPRDPTASAIPRAAMAHDTPLLYLIDHGGVAPRLFHGSPSIHALDLQPDAPLPPPPDPTPQRMAQSHWMGSDPRLREGILTELAADGMPFGGIQVVGGLPADAAVFEARGFVPLLLRGSLLVARFEGCAAELQLPPGSLDREPVFYEVGLFSPTGIAPEPRTLAARPIDPKTPAVDGAIHVPLRDRPCGDVWLRVVWDVDRSSSFTDGDRTCRHANPDGRLIVKIGPDHPAVRCAPSR